MHFLVSCQGKLILSPCLVAGLFRDPHMIVSVSDIQQDPIHLFSVYSTPLVVTIIYLFFCQAILVLANNPNRISLDLKLFTL